MSDLRIAAQQALEALEYAQQDRECPSTTRQAITALRAALAQQAEPVQDQRCRAEPRSDGDFVCDCKIGECPGRSAEPAQEPVAWKQGNLVTFNEDPYPALGGLFVQFWDGEEVAARVYANDLETIRQRCAKVNTAPPQQVAQQAEPLNLRDPAVQKRLATQWGYVPAAAQAEPVEPVAWSGYDLDGMVEAFSRVIEAHYQRANPFQHPIDMDAQMALRVLRGFIPAMKAYTAPPQRKLVPLTEEEIKTAFHAARNAKLGASQDNSRHRLSVIEIARAVEKASWEKNHGQA